MGDGPVLVLGARGMLGADVMAALAAAGIPAFGLDLPEFDITDEAALSAVLVGGPSGPISPATKIGAEAPPTVAAVINCAAYTDVEGAEDHEALAHKVNCEAVGVLGSLAEARGKYVIHISMDFVFDGEKNGTYGEDDRPNPVSAYGRTKLAGEQALAASGCRHAVMRIQWTYGRSGSHFVSKIAGLSRGRDRIMVVDDQRAASTATTEVAEAILTLLRVQVEGLYHFAAAGEASRFEVAQAIVAGLGLSTVVEPCGSDAFPAKARRPANSRFCCEKIEALLGRAIRPRCVALDEYLEEGA